MKGFSLVFVSQKGLRFAPDPTRIETPGPLPCNEFRPVAVVETRDLSEGTLLDLDARDSICGITIEHASARAEILNMLSPFPIYLFSTET